MHVKLPKERPYDYYNVGDQIVVYITFKENKEYTEENNGWYFGEVRNRYRHHDGCVSYILYDIGPNDDTGGFWGCGSMTPTILKIDEFSYFYSHPEEHKVWFKEALDYLHSSDFEFQPIRDIDIAQFAKILLK